MNSLVCIEKIYHFECKDIFFDSSDDFDTDCTYVTLIYRWHHSSSFKNSLTTEENPPIESISELTKVMEATQVQVCIDATVVISAARYSEVTERH